MGERALSGLFAEYEAGKDGCAEDGIGGFVEGFALGCARAAIAWDIARRLPAQGLSPGHVAEVSGLARKQAEGLSTLLRLERGTA